MFFRIFKASSVFFNPFLQLKRSQVNLEALVLLI